jgi:hypothetical protein
MKPGPRPKPTLLHRLQATYNITRHGSRADPVAPGDLRQPPSWLDAVQKRRFRELLHQAPPHLLRRAGAGILASYVIVESVVAEANTTPMWSSCRRRRPPQPRPDKLRRVRRGKDTLVPFGEYRPLAGE